LVRERKGTAPLVREVTDIAPILDSYKACGHTVIVFDETDTAVILVVRDAGVNLIETDSAVVELV
jgi:hypothetical protein